MTATRIPRSIRTILTLICSVALIFVTGCGLFSTNPEDTNWTVQSSGTDSVLYDVWGVSGDNVFAVGRDGTIIHYNGDRWSTMESGSRVHLYSVCGRAANDVYAVGDSGVVLHFDGSNWTDMGSRIYGNLRGVWTAPGRSAYAAGSDGIYRYDEGVWRRIRFLPAARSIIGFDGRIHSVVSAADFHLYAAIGRRLYMSVNSGWTAGHTVVSGIIYDLWGMSPANVFAVTSRGQIFHNEGNGLAPMEHPGAAAVVGIHGRSLEDVYAVGSYGVIFHFNGDQWESIGSPTKERLNSVWVADNGEVFVVGSAGVILNLAP